VGVERTIARLAAGLRGSAGARRADAAVRVAMMAGAVMIARASDPAVGQFVLDSVRDRLGLNDPTPPEPAGTDQGDAS
jgi:hypothetical protein